MVLVLNSSFVIFKTQTFSLGNLGLTVKLESAKMNFCIVQQVYDHFRK